MIDERSAGQQGAQQDESWTAGVAAPQPPPILTRRVQRDCFDKYQSAQYLVELLRRLMHCSSERYGVATEVGL